VNQKEIDLDPQQIKSQINELKMELEQVRDPDEAKRLRQQLHKLQINQLLALDYLINAEGANFRLINMSLASS